MNRYIGIDLGTTNSAICSYDGKDTRLWKSPEQSDVTPSAIFYDRRGRRFLGQRAYDAAAQNPDGAALLFKRLMGSSTPIELPAAGLSFSPEECSAEILKLLFSYLPDEVKAEVRGTVVTVPAAFNQMQNEATVNAAELADLGPTALMQEPVAAVMTAMKYGRNEGMFLIYDLGGGTLDLAVAENHGGRINLLAHGGLAVCGGRDFDRALVGGLVRPWLLENFDLPEDFLGQNEYRLLNRLCAWAAEKAKVELSGRDSAIISLSEMEARSRDRQGREIYLDIDLKRADLGRLIDEQLEESLAAAREILAQASISLENLAQVVFIGGPTNYKPLRDKISKALGLADDLRLNPMTAVAEGAALFAESIDWSSQSRGRKKSRQRLQADENNPLEIIYQSRVLKPKAAIMIKKPEEHPGREFQLDNMASGWTSGRLPLKAESTLEVDLAERGEHIFKISVFDESGQSLPLPDKRLVITRTAATVEAIPASHSVGVEILEALGRPPVLDYLVRAGDPLPKKGHKIFKAAVSLEAGSQASLNLKLWEGEIESPISDNRSIGVLKISGADFDQGLIPAGADLDCEYEVYDSGAIRLEVSVPAIGAVFNSERNFYSRQEGQLNLNESASLIIDEAQELLNRIYSFSDVVDDPRLNLAKNKLTPALRLRPGFSDPEEARAAQEKLLEARRLLAQARRANLAQMRQVELDEAVGAFESYAADYSFPSEMEAFRRQSAAAQRAIDHGSADFEQHLKRIQQQKNKVLWRQDWYILEIFDYHAERPYRFSDSERFNELVAKGRAARDKQDAAAVRAVLNDLGDIIISDEGRSGEGYEVVNIFRGARH